MASLSKQTEKDLYLNLKKNRNFQPSWHKDKQFAKKLEAISGLTFAEFYALLGESTFVLAEAYTLFGRENYLEKAEQLGELSQRLSEFASEANVPLSKA